MSEKTWPNWNNSSIWLVSWRISLSMSEKTWPNWNDLINSETNEEDPSIYPCLKRRGPIETQAHKILEVVKIIAIHVWKDVAQLKLRLKDSVYPVGYLAIHVWKDVAQLKLRSIWWFPAIDWTYPCLKRRGPIETSVTRFIPAPPPALSMSEKTWPNWNWGAPQSLNLIFDCLSMSEKTWPNWNIIKVNYNDRYAGLSMSEKTWPNWNIKIVNFFFTQIPSYPCLKRRGPIETPSLSEILGMSSWTIHVWKDVAQLKLLCLLGLHFLPGLSMSEKTWPNWNRLRRSI